MDASRLVGVGVTRGILALDEYWVRPGGLVCNWALRFIGEFMRILTPCALVVVGIRRASC